MFVLLGIIECGELAICGHPGTRDVLTSCGGVVVAVSTLVLGAVGAFIVCRPNLG